MKPVVVRPAAAADIEDAYHFLATLRSTLNRVVTHSEAFPVVHRATRRALITERFPYGLFYRVYDDVIVVVACMHAKRDPRRWQRRS